MAISKNSKVGRGDGQRTRMYQDKVVRATLYDGRGAGHGKYMAAYNDQGLVLDKKGKPYLYCEIGELI